jgi:prepilin signal peptidase PulO-like enzyme (type II secretory pathway)
MGLGAGLFFLLAVFDVRFFILPDYLTIVLALVGFSLALPQGFHHVLYQASAGFLFALLFAILYAGSQGRWLGFGDVKLVAAIGFLFGYVLGIIVIVGAIWLASLVGLGLILLHRAHMKTALPLGAFLSGAAIIVIVFYNQIHVLTRFFL